VPLNSAQRNQRSPSGTLLVAACVASATRVIGAGGKTEVLLTMVGGKTVFATAAITGAK